MGSDRLDPRLAGGWEGVARSRPYSVEAAVLHVVYPPVLEQRNSSVSLDG